MLIFPSQLSRLFFGCVLFVFPGLVHVGDELREVNGNLVTHKRPDEISQILVKKELKEYSSCNIIDYDCCLIISPNHRVPLH